MSNQEFDTVIGFLIITCVLITVIWLLLKCVSSLFSEPQQHIYTSMPSYINERVIHDTMGNRTMQSLSAIKNIMRSKKLIAIDTESVETGFKGSQSMLARVSLVTEERKVYDKFVKPTQPVTDYRTFVSGIRRMDLVDAEDYYKVRKEVAYLLKDCILIGHDVKNDLDSLDLTHPTEDIRDTSTFETFREIYLVNHDVFKNVMKKKWMNMTHYDSEDVADTMMKAFSKTQKCLPKNQKLSLKWLAKHLLKRDIQVGEHSSAEDARAAMDLYLLYENNWEAQMRNRRDK